MVDDMKNTFNIVAIAAAGGLMGTSALAGGFDRQIGGPDVLFEKGTYAEAYFAVSQPDVAGSVAATGAETNNIADNYERKGFGFKTDLNDSFSVSLEYSEPVGVDITYPTFPILNPATGANVLGQANGLRGTIDSTVLKILGKYQFNENMSLYGGIKYLSMDATAAFGSGAINLNVANDDGIGFVLGAAYEVPSIALRASVTYESAIDTDHDTTEVGLFTGGAALDRGKSESGTPQSIRLDFKTGVHPRALVFGSIHWAEWSDKNVVVAPDVSAVGGTELSTFDDYYRFTLGGAFKANDWLSLILSGYYETESGESDENQSFFTPIGDRRALTVAARFTLNEHAKVTAGLTRVWLGDASTRSISPAADIPVEFNDSTAWGAGIKVGINF